MTNLRDKISVEPLASDRVARIEENVVAAYRDAARSQAPVRSTLATALRYLAPAAAVCGVAFAIFVNLRAARQAAPQQAAVVPAEPESIMIATGEGESTRIELEDAAILVGTNTTIEVLRVTGGEINVHLRSGRVDCEVEPLAGRAPFAVRAGDVAVTVVGTAFSVQRDEMVTVRVTRGKVRVDSPDGARSLAAGEEWAGRATRVAMADVPAPDPPTAPAADPAPPAPVEDPKADLRAERESKVPDVAKTNGRKNGNGHRAADQESEANSSTGNDAAPARSSRVANCQDPLPAIQNKYRSTPQLAIDEQEEQVRKRGKQERLSFYRRAYVELFVLNKPSAALKTAKIFQRRFRGGRFQDEILWIRTVAGHGSGAGDLCRQAASEYLQRYATSKYAGAARAIVDPM